MLNGEDRLDGEESQEAQIFEGRSKEVGRVIGSSHGWSMSSSIWAMK
jgi:hypothetical protein